MLGTAFAWQMRSRYAAGEGAQRNFQTAGLNGVFGYFCRRGQKYPAPGRGISLWTIPPSKPAVLPPPFTQGRLWSSAPAGAAGRCTPRVLASLRGHRPLRTVSRSAVFGRTGSSALRTYSSAVLPLLCGGGFSCQESKMRATKTGADVV